MEMQNITLSLPKATLRKVKLLAVQRGTSVSGLLRAELERMAAQEDAYARAREQHVWLLEEGLHLGTEGRVTTTRDELYERH